MTISERAWVVAIKHIIDSEGGFTKAEWDPGNWTGGKEGVGELKGTKWGISAASYPTLNIEALTREEAEQIYYNDYWIPLIKRVPAASWHVRVLAMSAAVNMGVGAAVELLERTKLRPDAFVAAWILRYTALKVWEKAGKGWMRRVVHAMDAAEAVPLEVEAVIINRGFPQRVLDAATGPIIKRRQLVRISHLADGSGLKVDIAED